MAISRKTWGARGFVPLDPRRKAELYVHHTVSSSRKRTKAEERSHMRELEATHIGNGWATIGYSYVLFPSGRLYEGRGLKGLPAAQGGHNSGTWAVALVGNYEVAHTTRRQRLRLRLLLWNLSRRGLRGLGGHRDAPGQATACPGRHVVPVVDRLARRARLKRL